MARGGRFSITVDYKDVARRLEVAVSRVERGTKKATIAACEEIGRLSRAQVPTATGALADSFYYEVQGSVRNFTAEVGYGGPKDRRNPKTGQMTSEYMIAVHEDLTAHHPVGNAKFLENAVNEYRERFLAKAASKISTELG